jgi:hypothetical protein
MYNAGLYFGWILHYFFQDTRAIRQLFPSCLKLFIYYSNISIGISNFSAKNKKKLYFFALTKLHEICFVFYYNKLEGESHKLPSPPPFHFKLLKIEKGERNERAGIDSAFFSRSKSMELKFR